jgi:hypothetical protein
MDVAAAAPCETLERRGSGSVLTREQLSGSIELSMYLDPHSQLPILELPLACDLGFGDATCPSSTFLFRFIFKLLSQRCKICSLRAMKSNLRQAASLCNSWRIASTGT